MRKIHLVRHGRPTVVPERPAAEWELDPSGFADIETLRTSGLLPEDAVWFSSPEPKALETARRLTDREVTIVDELREHERGPTPWFDDRAQWRTVLHRVFAEPEVPALPGWEPLSRTTARLLPVVRRILAENPDDEIVLAGHGTAWTALKASLLGVAPDLDAWDRLRMPDLWVVPLADVIRPGRDRRRLG